MLLIVGDNDQVTHWALDIARSIVVLEHYYKGGPSIIITGSLQMALCSQAAAFKRRDLYVVSSSRRDALKFLVLLQKNILLMFEEDASGGKENTSKDGCMLGLP